MQAVEPAKKKERPLRRDARRNRDAIMTAAAEAFAKEGVNAPLESVAKAAGVAIGTLYGHFPTRQDLIEVIATEKIATWLDAAERAAGADDPWRGFTDYLEVICKLQADDQALSDIASTGTPLAECIESRLARIRELGRIIMVRAQEQGTLRSDVSPDDMAIVILAHRGIVAATRDVAPEAWRRHLALMLEGFRSERAHPLPSPPPITAHGDTGGTGQRAGDQTICKVFSSQ
ncbi:TetR/AcrR family transcriptional regulator [Streptomyces rubiginosohelvolus]|uniref:TetR/AcrR family transcriptional regulator n=1 Tax=Streptomyces rubiginosohelvolus TaxID=67362 RepID=UPI003722DE52